MTRIHYLPLLCMLALAPAHPVSFNTELDLEELQEEDIDILIGHFGNLVAAFEKVFTDENSILEKRIDQVFMGFDNSMKCAIDQLVSKGESAMGRVLPKFEFFEGEDVQFCRSVVLIGRGDWGTLDHARFSHCRLKERIRVKPVTFDAIVSGYSGLKEMANAAYCTTKERGSKSEYALSKQVYANAGILIEAYSDISKLPGCKTSEPDQLYDCTKRYYDKQTATLSTFSSNDTSQLDLSLLEVSLEQITPPTVEKEYLGLIVKEVLTREQLSNYEGLIGQLRRNVDLAKLSLAKRKKLYQQLIADNVSKISPLASELDKKNSEHKHFITCTDVGFGCLGYGWPSFDAKFEPLKGYVQPCKLGLLDPKLKDLVTENDRLVCGSVSDTALKRVSEIRGYLNEVAERWLREAKESKRRQEIRIEFN